MYIKLFHLEEVGPQMLQFRAYCQIDIGRTLNFCPRSSLPGGYLIFFITFSDVDLLLVSIISVWFIFFPWYCPGYLGNLLNILLPSFEYTVDLFVVKCHHSI